MRFFTIYLFVFIFFGGLSAQPLRRTVEAGRIIVKLKPGVAPAVEAKLRTISRTASDTSVLSVGIKSFDRINRRYRATGMRRVFPDAGEYEAKHRKYGLHLWYEITIPEGEDPEKVAAGYGADENLQISEPRYRIRSLAMPAPPLPAAEIPNDPSFNRQWHYKNTGQTGGTPGADIRLTDAWERIKSTGIKNSNVIVAVVDGGVYYDHEDLKANMWVNKAELNGITNVDDDGNGYRDDIYGYNFVGRTGTIAPEDHATHVAGTIAAVTNNSTGVAGISGNPADGYGIKIMTVQILDGDRGTSSIGPAYTYAADNGAVISQNSWGYEEANEYNQSDIAAINYFIEQAGRDKNGNPRAGTPMAGGIVIFAAGNDGKDDKWYPAYFDNVLAVAATNHYGKLAWYSNFGDWVDISAPGGDTNETGKNRTGGIYSTSYRASNKNYYEYMQGTSMACPHVSGVAALILSVYGSESYTPDMLRSRLLCSATPLAGFDPANASKMGAGQVNALAALAPERTDAAPVVVNPLPDITLRDVAKETAFYAGSVFTYSGSNALTYGITVSPSKVASARVNGDSIYIKSATAGVATLTLTAYDGTPCGTPSTSTLIVTPNHAPIFSGLFADTTLIPYSNPVTVDLAGYVFDPDYDPMTFTVQTSKDGLVNAAINGRILTVYPHHHGNVTLLITASDLYTAKTAATIRVTVEQKYAPDKADQLLVYPNPVSDILWYSYILDKKAPVSMRIINAVGQTVYQTPAKTLPAGTYYYNIDLYGWGIGMYFLQYIKDGKVTDTKKVVKY